MKEQLIRFNTISVFPSEMRLEAYKEPEQANMPYVVDTSSFIPMSEAVKKVTGRMPSSERIAHTYDFPNGKGSADKIPIDRTHRFTGDIAEVSVAVREASEKYAGNVADAAEAYKAEQAQADIAAQMQAYETAAKSES